MQLHACLLLFIITTDITVALLQPHCGGDVSLDKQPAGHINLTLPGLSSDTTNTPDPVNHQSDRTPNISVCTWTLAVPAGRTVLLKSVWLDGGSSVVVRCVLNEEDKVLESGATALLSHCDENKATFTWTGEGLSSNVIQLSYYVQEDERNSSEDHTSPHSDQDLLRWSQTGTSFTSTAPVGQDVVRGTDRVRGRRFEGLELSSGSQSASSPSSHDPGPLHPTSPLQGLSVAGRADRETLPLPEEEPNNGADTSGAAHLADGEMSASERTHPYFQPTDSLFHTSHTAKKTSDQRPQTQMAATHATATSSSTLLGTYIHKYTATQTSKLSTNTPAGSSSRVQPLNSTSPSNTTWEGDTVLIPRDGAVSGASKEELPHSWRSHRSTDGLISDLTSAFTSDPVKSPTEPQHGDSHTDTEPTASSQSSSQASNGTQLSTTHMAKLEATVGATEVVSFHPSTSGTDSSAASGVTGQTASFSSSDELEMLPTFTSSTQSETSSPQSTEGLARSPPPDTSSPFTQTSKDETHTTRTTLQSKHRHFADTAITEVDDQTLSFTGSSSTPLTLGDLVQTSAPSGTTTDTETYTLSPTYTPLHDSSPTNSQTPVPPLSSSTSIHSPTPSYTLQTHTALPGPSHLTHTSLSLPSSTTESSAHTPLIDHKTTAPPSQTIKYSHTPHTQNQLPLTSSTKLPVTLKQPRNYITTAQTSLLSLTTAKSDHGRGGGEEESWQRLPGSTTTQTPTAGAPSWTPHPSQENRLALTPSVLTSARSPTTIQTPKFYIVPDQPSAIKVESIELLLQIVVEESRSAFTSGLEEDTAAWVEPYLQKAPGFSRLMGVWSSGNAVQSLVEFRTSGALRWLGKTGPASLLERTGLAQAAWEGRSFRSSKITNITLGGLQGDVCDWLLQCPAGYKCVFNPGSSNYSCSSVCHFDYCHHHGICTHHSGELPVCRCLVGEDFWYMGQRCDVRMTRARLVGACLAILLVMVTVIGVLALVAVRRYRALLIQAKVDQTRSSYRRFNHFDELSGRFWLRSWAGSADSLDNPAFTRSDELLHLRALDRPCCYHDDTLSLASTCPSHGTRINTIYPHSSQYGWRGSEMSMGDGVLDSGKASDLSVCSWPVEPIQWTPFPLLQQLASHRTPTVRVSRPRSYCEGMELVDLGKSWTA
ncbi:mucin-2 [Anoplopoma fimbria]|uniref:mucin-2 n=1 Tax=Anoplopoma fimbria TaxID=229290 RepID=UPI0023EDB4CA|nr:mucin-2 [Anoplopoma fimbria]